MKHSMSWCTERSFCFQKGSQFWHIQLSVIYRHLLSLTHSQMLYSVVFFTSTKSLPYQFKQLPLISHTQLSQTLFTGLEWVSISVAYWCFLLAASIKKSILSRFVRSKFMAIKKKSVQNWMCTTKPKAVFGEIVQISVESKNEHAAFWYWIIFNLGQRMSGILEKYRSHRWRWCIIDMRHMWKPFHTHKNVALEGMNVQLVFLVSSLQSQYRVIIHVENVTLCMIVIFAVRSLACCYFYCQPEHSYQLGWFNRWDWKNSAIMTNIWFTWLWIDWMNRLLYMYMKLLFSKKKKKKRENSIEAKLQ